MASPPEPENRPSGRSSRRQHETDQDRRWLRPRVLALIGTVTTAVIVAAVTAPVEQWVKDLFGTDKPERTTLQLVPRQVTFQSATAGWIAPGKTLPVAEREEITQILRRWQANGEAVPALQQWITFTLQSSTPKTITIDSLEIQKECQDALAGPHFQYHGGRGGVTSKLIKVDLDSPVTKIVPSSGDMATDPEQSQVTAFPFAVTDEEMTYFALLVRAQKRDCRWKGALNWSVDGKSGTTEISNQGNMLRLTGISAATGKVLY